MNTNNSFPDPTTHPELSTPARNHVVERNIHALLSRQQQEDAQRGVQDKIADAITKFTGSMTFVFLHLLLFGGWVVVNLGWTPLPKFDPTFVVLAMFASVEAIFLSTFVLITQNRMAALADKRANLDLQISLLAEHEITRILKLVRMIAERDGVNLGDVTELEQLAEDVQPEAVLDTIETAEKRSDEEAKNRTR